MRGRKRRSSSKVESALHPLLAPMEEKGRSAAGAGMRNLKPGMDWLWIHAKIAKIAKRYDTYMVQHISKIRNVHKVMH